MLKEIGMIDVWRELHPHDKCYTFFSHPHSVHSSIDYFFTFNLDRQKIVKCDIGVKILSDDAGMYLTLYLYNKPKETLWRLNTCFLNDPQCQKYIKEGIKEHTNFNNNGAVSPSTLWDAAKAVIRGKLVKWSVQKKKEKEIKGLTEKLAYLERTHGQQ